MLERILRCLPSFFDHPGLPAATFPIHSVPHLGDAPLQLVWSLLHFALVRTLASLPWAAQVCDWLFVPSGIYREGFSFSAVSFVSGGDVHILPEA